MLHSFPPQDGSGAPFWVVIAAVCTHPLIIVFPHITSPFINTEFHLPFYHPLTLYPAALCSLQQSHGKTSSLQLRNSRLTPLTEGLPVLEVVLTA